MEYLIDLKFEDQTHSAVVHFVATFNVSDDAEAKLFVNELLSAFKRRGVTVYPPNYYRIDNDKLLKERSFEYYEFCKSRATASVEIEQFFLEGPDQNKSLVENLTHNMFAGKDSTAAIGSKYNIPVRVVDKKTRNPISGELYYFSIEQLIPKK